MLLRKIGILIVTFVCSLNLSLGQTNFTSELVVGLNVFNDYQVGINEAKKANKPVLIYFNSKMSPNCRKIEKNLLSVDKVREYLLKNYVVISLYVDDKTANTKGGKFKTVGEYNYDIEQSIFKMDSQPYLVVLDKQNNQIKGMGYSKEPKDFLKFLKANRDKWDAKN